MTSHFSVAKGAIVPVVLLAALAVAVLASLPLDPADARLPAPAPPRPASVVYADEAALDRAAALDASAAFLEAARGYVDDRGLVCLREEVMPIEPHRRTVDARPLAHTYYRRGSVHRVASAPAAEGGTATYNIKLALVTLHDGTRLEAHSGLGPCRDRVECAALRARGPTPPGVTYRVEPREGLFHGVQAVRLTPLDGDTHGRAGFLAHPYMMGDAGDSNGCMSVRDYDAFLRAVERGQVRRLEVVAGT